MDKNLIIKNTIVLYIRAFFSLIISLYTTRIILNNLGIENFGIYQVVGGIVLLFSFLNISLSNATERYISYYIGLGEEKNLNKLFGMTINIHLFISIIILLLIEIFGTWYIKYSANLGEIQISDVYLVLHMSALGLVFNIISVPYRAFLISKEKITSFAYIDLLSVFLKLIVAMLLILFSENRLVVYAFLLMMSSVFVAFIYKIICNKKIPESSYVLNWDKKMFKEILFFTGWTTVPAIASIMKGQGTILLLNSFFGPVLNASQGIANQVKAGIKTFSLNLLAAFTPQITITYAEKDYETMKKLVLSGNKITFLIFLTLCIPVIIERDFILSMWLVVVPDYTSIVVLLVLLDTIVSLMSSTFNIAIRATGKIKNYEISVNSIHIIGFPLSFILLKTGFNFDSVFLLWIFLSFIALFFECYWLNRVLPFISLKEILLSNILVMLISGLFIFCISYVVFINLEQSFIRLILVIITSSISLVLCSYFFAFNEIEKKMISKYLNKIFRF